MAGWLSISEILEVAKISQYLAAQDELKKSQLKGGALDVRQSRMIYTERTPIQKVFDLNPFDSTLRDTSNYLFAILGPYAKRALQIRSNIIAGRPIVAGPQSISVPNNTTVAFTITVTSTTPVVIRWYRDGVLIPNESGLTLTFTAFTPDNGSTYYAVVQNSAGATISQTATLTVTAGLLAYIYYGDVDYYSEISVGVDNVPYVFNIPVSVSGPLQMTFPPAATPNKWIVVKYPVSLGIKTQWVNTPEFNYGTIPDFVMRNVMQIGQFYYILSRNAMTLDVSNSPNLILT